jgi:hypothetical protein
MGDWQLVGGPVQEVVQVAAVVTGGLAVAVAAKELAHDAAAPRGAAIVLHGEGGGFVLGHLARSFVLSRGEAQVVMGFAGTSSRLARDGRELEVTLATERESKHVPAVVAAVRPAARQLTAELPKRPVAAGLRVSHVTRLREGGWVGKARGGVRLLIKWKRAAGRRWKSRSGASR